MACRVNATSGKHTKGYTPRFEAYGQVIDLTQMLNQIIFSALTYQMAASDKLTI